MSSLVAPKSSAGSSASNKRSAAFRTNQPGTKAQNTQSPTLIACAAPAPGLLAAAAMEFTRGPAAWVGARGRLLLLLIPLMVLLFPLSSFAKDPPLPGKDPASEAIQKAVLRVEVSIARRDWSAPWKLEPPISGSATAFAIGPDRLLTNAHVVRDAQQITVKKNDGSAPAIATVEAVDDDCDLAVLRLPDKALLAGIHPLKIGALPAVGSSVTTYGYPLGGLELSTTTGVVSRFEAIQYGVLGAHLAGQTDAAINPGNSGGPVVQGGLVVGVAFELLKAQQNIAFFIPAPIVRHFLDDLADGHYAGFPDLSASFSKLESPAARRERGLPEGRSGVIVEAIQSGSNLQGVLAPGDVLLSVEGERIADDGTYAFGTTRLPFGELLDMKSIGQTARFEVWRDGKAVTVPWTASRYAPWEHLRKARGAARYLVFGGLVFVPLTLDFLLTAKPTVDRREAIYRALGTLVWGPSSEPADREIVLVARVLPDPVNEGVADNAPLLLNRVNGEPVHDLAGLARILDESHAKRDVFEVGTHDHIEAIDHEKAVATRAAFLAAHGMTHDRSL
jgi:S1-C subfamily serine protease